MNHGEDEGRRRGSSHVVSGLEEAESWKTSPTPTPDADQGPVAKFNCGKEHEESKLKASAQCPKRRQWLAVDLCCSQGSPCHLASDKVTAGPRYCTSMYELTEHHQGLQTAGRTSGQTTINFAFLRRPMLAASLRPLFHTVEPSRDGHQERS